MASSSRTVDSSEIAYAKETDSDVERKAESDTRLRRMMPKKFDKLMSIFKKKKVEEEDKLSDRDSWSNNMDFLCSIVGFAVDLANVWRFPYLCFKNGGGAFLIPYVLVLVFAGIPLFYLELALGQYFRKGAITTWGEVCPMLKGVGYCVVLISFYTGLFYNIVIAKSLYYMFASFTPTLPWDSCDNYWNTMNCSASYDNSTMNTTGAHANPSEEFYQLKVLGLSEDSSISNLGNIQIYLVLCFAVVEIICYFSLWKGIKTSGKIVYFTAIFPYVVLFILLVRGATLPGSDSGIIYYLRPNMTKLKNKEPWVDAATQVFFSLGPGFGVLLAYASYNNFHNNVYRDALITSSINCMTSFASGFAMFSVLGYLANKRSLSIETVIKEDPSLVFTVYPVVLSTFTPSNLWAFLFFLMLVNLGLDSTFGGAESIITALSDEFPILKKHRKLFVMVLFMTMFSIGILECTQGGDYVFYMIESTTIQYPILFAVFCECVCVSWIYGVDRIAKNIKSMVGFEPGIFWRISWKYFSPLVILANLIYGLVEHRPLSYNGKDFPDWACVLGWLLTLSSVMFIPGFAVYTFIMSKGSFTERMAYITRPVNINKSYDSAMTDSQILAMNIKKFRKNSSQVEAV